MHYAGRMTIVALGISFGLFFSCSTGTDPGNDDDDTQPVDQEWRATCAVSCGGPNCGGGNFPEIVCADSEAEALAKADVKCNSNPPCNANIPGCPPPSQGSCTCFEAEPQGDPC